MVAMFARHTLLFSLLIGFVVIINYVNSEELDAIEPDAESSVPQQSAVLTNSIVAPKELQGRGYNDWLSAIDKFTDKNVENKHKRPDKPKYESYSFSDSDSDSDESKSNYKPNRPSRPSRPIKKPTKKSSESSGSSSEQQYDPDKWLNNKPKKPYRPPTNTWKSDERPSKPNRPNKNKKPYKPSNKYSSESSDESYSKSHKKPHRPKSSSSSSEESFEKFSRHSKEAYPNFQKPPLPTNLPPPPHNFLIEDPYYSTCCIDIQNSMVGALRVLTTIGTSMTSQSDTIASTASLMQNVTAQHEIIAENIGQSSYQESVIMEELLSEANVVNQAVSLLVEIAYFLGLQNVSI